MGKRKWNLMKGFLADIISRLHISERRIRVASVQFSSSASTINWFFNNYTDNLSLQKAVHALPYLSDKVNFANGLDLLKTYIFNPDHGDRPGVKNILVVLSSSKHLVGLSDTISRDTQLQKLADIVPVSIGKTSPSDFQRVLNNNKYLVDVESFNSLANEKNKSIDYVCSAMTTALVASLRFQKTTGKFFFQHNLLSRQCQKCHNSIDPYAMIVYNV